jgi:hypothetical protein
MNIHRLTLIAVILAALTRLSSPSAQAQLVYQGLTNTSLGSATLSLSNNQLVVSNIGTDGQDGVAVEMNQPGTPTTLVTSWLSLDPSNALPVGAYLQEQVIGTAGAVSNGVLGSLTITKMGTSNYVDSMDFTSLGATSATVQVYNGNTLVGQAQVGGSSGPLYEVAEEPNDGDTTVSIEYDITGTCDPCMVPYSCNCKGVVVTASRAWNYTTYIAITNGPTFVGNLVVVTPLGGSHISQVSAQQILVANISSITITQEAVSLVFQGLTNASVGSAAMVLNSNDTQLTVSNIGTDGQDGVNIELPSGYSLQDSWLLLDPSNALPVGAYVRSQVIGTAGAVSNGVLGSLTITKMGTSNYVDSMDFTSLGATSATVQVYNGNTLVGQAQVGGSSGPLYEMSIMPNDDDQDAWSADYNTCDDPCNSGTCCVVVSVSRGCPSLTAIAFINGATNFGNHVVVTPLGGSQISQVSAHQILAANIPSITITNETVSPPAQFQISSIVRTNSSDMLVTWTFPLPRPVPSNLITNVVQVTTNTTGGYNPSNYVDLATVLINTSPTNYLDVGGATAAPARFYRLMYRP